MMLKKQDRLIYFLSETHFFSKNSSILVVGLIGPLDRANLPIFEDCGREVLKVKPNLVILNFREVSARIDYEILSPLNTFLKQVREIPAELRVSGAHPELRKLMERDHLVHAGELMDNLAQALEAAAKMRSAA